MRFSIVPGNDAVESWESRAALKRAEAAPWMLGVLCSLVHPVSRRSPRGVSLTLAQFAAVIALASFLRPEEIHFSLSLMSMEPLSD